MELVYRSDGEIADGERFDFIWRKFDDNIFGVMHMKMGEGEEIRETEFSYQIYLIDPNSDTPFTLLNECYFGQTDSFVSSSVGFEVFEYEGEYYFVSAWTEGITKIEF